MQDAAALARTGAYLREALRGCDSNAEKLRAVALRFGLFPKALHQPLLFCVVLDYRRGSGVWQCVLSPSDGVSTGFTVAFPEQEENYRLSEFDPSELLLVLRAVSPTGEFVSALAPTGWLTEYDSPSLLDIRLPEMPDAMARSLRDDYPPGALAHTLCRRALPFIRAFYGSGDFDAYIREIAERLALLHPPSSRRPQP